jgi:hypothetical protein
MNYHDNCQQNSHYLEVDGKPVLLKCDHRRTTKLTRWRHMIQRWGYAFDFFPSDVSTRLAEGLPVASDAVIVALAGSRREGHTLLPSGSVVRHQPGRRVLELP